MKVRARVYFKDGNRLLIQGHWYSDDDPEIGLGSMSAVLCESMLFGVVCGFDAKQEWVELESGEDGHGSIKHYPYNLTGRQFEHGGVRALLIGGPLFDQEEAAA